MLEKIAVLVPRAAALSEFPAISRDLNLVVDERVRWSDLEVTVKSAAGVDLERIQYRDTYRDRERLGAGKKSQLLTVIFRRASGTLAGAEADQIRDQIVAACQRAHGAVLRA
jgi:phenylalanyl-tRNA synthetase beta chain